MAHPSQRRSSGIPDETMGDGEGGNKTAKEGSASGAREGELHSGWQSEFKECEPRSEGPNAR